MTAPAVATPQTDANAQSVKVTVAESPAAGIDYVILSRQDEAGRIIYVHEKNVTARDTDKAIEKYAEQNGNKAGTFIAIPASRWKPVKVTPETVTTLKLEEAKG